MRRIVALVSLTLVLAACVPPEAPTPASRLTPLPTWTLPPTATVPPTPLPTPTPDVARLAEGWAALAAGDLDAAAQIAAAVLAQDEYAAEAYALRGTVQDARFEIAAAVADLEQARRLGYETVDLLERLGRLYLGQRVLAWASDEQYAEFQGLLREVYERLLELDPTNLTANEVLLIMDAPVDGGTDVGDADPAAVERYAAAESYFYQGQYEQAIVEYQAAIEIDPAFSLPYLYLGDVYYIQGRYDEAVRWFEQAVALNPGLFQGWGFLGDGYWYLGLPLHAREAYDMALLLLPDYPLARAGLDNVNRLLAHWQDTYFCPYGFRFGFFADVSPQANDLFGGQSAERGAFLLRQNAGAYLFNLVWQPISGTWTIEQLGDFAVQGLQSWDEVDLVGEPQSFPYGDRPIAYQLYRYAPEGEGGNAGAQANWTCGEILFTLQVEAVGVGTEDVHLYFFPQLEALRCTCAER